MERDKSSCGLVSGVQHTHGIPGAPHHPSLLAPSSLAVRIQAPGPKCRSVRLPHRDRPWSRPHRTDALTQSWLQRAPPSLGSEASTSCRRIQVCPVPQPPVGALPLSQALTCPPMTPGRPLLPVLGSSASTASGPPCLRAPLPTAASSEVPITSAKTGTREGGL